MLLLLLWLPCCCWSAWSSLRWSSSFSVRSRSSLRSAASFALDLLLRAELPGRLGGTRGSGCGPRGGAGSGSSCGRWSARGRGGRRAGLRVEAGVEPPRRTACHRLAALVSWRPSRRVDCGGLRAAAAASSSFRLDASWNIPETRLLSLFQYGSKCAMAVVDASSDVPTEATGFANETRARFGTPGASASIRGRDGSTRIRTGRVSLRRALPSVCVLAGSGRVA